MLVNRALYSLLRIPMASTARASEIQESLSEIRNRVTAAAGTRQATLVAVSKYKPASDISVCYEAGQRDFGENYVQELAEKASQLPQEIRWHFIGTLQSNKAKTLAAIPNLHSVHTLTSSKTASLLQKSLPEKRTNPLNVLIQINTSGEDAKSGLTALSPQTSQSENSDAVQLAKHVVKTCPSLRFLGLMTIGALEASLNASETDENRDFDRLKQTRDVMTEVLKRESEDIGKWGDGDGRLLVSMGMSSDFEPALKAGSDIVRVGTGIFGGRKSKEEMKK